MPLFAVTERMPFGRSLRQRRGYILAMTTAATLVWGLVLSALVAGPAPPLEPRKTTAIAPGVGVPDDGTWADAKARLAEAESRRSAAMMALDRFLADHFSQIERDPVNRPAFTATVDAPADPPLDWTANPQWKAIADRLAAREGEAAQLADRVTGEHPDLVRLRDEIVQLQEQLAATPQMVEAKADPQAGTPALPAPPIATTTADADDLPTANAANGLAAARSYEGLWRELSAAEEELRGRRRELDAVVAERLDVPRHTARSATASASQQASPARAGRTWWAFLAVIAGMALSAGAVSLLTRPVPAPEVLSSVSEVESLLRLPVLGASGHAPLETPAEGGPLVRRLLLAAEGTVALAALAVVAISANRAGFLGQLAGDPVGAVREVLRSSSGS
jgi:hypothetical protein